MRIYKPIGSKDRLVEIFQNVNKVKLNEGLFEAGSPNLNAENVLNMAFDQLKNNRLNVEHTNTETNGDESFVVLACTDKQGNNITFTFHVVSSEGDQEGVSNINNISLNTFTFDSVDGEDTIEMAEDSLRNFNQQHGQELYDVVPELGEIGEPVENEVQEAIELIDAIKQDSYPFGGSPDDMQTGSGYADQKPTNDAVRVKSPELDQFIQEDMNSILNYSQGARDSGTLYPQAKELGTTNQYILRDALKDAGIELLSIEPSAKPGVFMLIFNANGKKYKGLIRSNYGNAAKVVNGIKKRLDVDGMIPIQEFDKPAMKLIQQAPGGATAGGVKQLEEKMTKPIVGGIGMGVNEIQMVGTETLGEPKPINPSTKSPVDDLPPEKRKIIMNAINALTRFKPDFAPSADQINTEILRQRNMPQVKESGELENTDDEIKRFYKEKDLATQHPEQISTTAELEPEEEPVPEVSPEKRAIILQAGDNLMARNARNPNYSPTINEILDEIDRIEGKKKPVKKFRGASSSAGEYYLSEVSTQSPYAITSKDMEQIFDRIDPNSDIKSQVIQAANEFVDVEMGVKRFSMPPEQYKKIVKNVSVQMYMAYLERIAVLNEDAEKGEYPDPLGKKFKPKKHYPKKKKKLDTTVKLTEDIYSDDDIETPDLPVDTAARRAQKQAKSDIYKTFDKHADPFGDNAERPLPQDTEFQLDMAEELNSGQPSTGEELLQKEYENLRQSSDTFAMLSDAYISLLELGQESKSDKKIQVSLSNIRDSIVEFLNMSDMQVTQQGVQDFFENDLEESLYEDKELGAEVTPEPNMGSMENLPDDGMSHEPEGDKIAQLAQDKEEQGEILQGGVGDGKSPLEFDSDQVIKGLEVEKEHSDDPLAAIEIVLDHLTEDPEYYTQKDTPEASAQANASADVSGEKSDVEKENPDLYPDGWKEMDGMFMNPNSPLRKGMEKQDDDKELTDRLLGYKPHNVGDEVNEVEDVFGRLGNILNPKNTEFSPNQVIADTIAKAKEKLAKVPAEIRAAVESGEYRKKFGLDTSGGSVWDFWRHNGFSDADAQIMSYLKDGKISLQESMSVADEKGLAQSIVNTPRPETGLVKEDNEKDIKDRDPASWHQIQIAKKTLKMPGAMAGVMGGMSKEEAKEILRKRGIKFDEK
jgi:hypothetical protein